MDFCCSYLEFPPPPQHTRSGRIWEGKRRGCVRHWINLENVGIEKGGDENLAGNG